MASDSSLLLRFRSALDEFLSKAPLEESTLIIDGPGIGCTSHFLLLGLLGLERLRRLKAAHFFSSSGYAPFSLHAQEQGQLRLGSAEITGWNARNQERHGIRAGVTAASFALAKVTGRKWFFKNHLAGDALRSTVTDVYADGLIAHLPENLHF